MNTAIILSGGVGTRMGTECPKQYLEVEGEPIIAYCLKAFQKHSETDNIIIVAAEEWHPFLRELAEKMKLTKLFALASAGRTRQHSIYNGLRAARDCTEDSGVVIIHDAARPMVSERIITDCLHTADKYGGAMPVITVKDTVYFSRSGDRIDDLPDRSCLYAGQAPEAFRFGEYYGIHLAASDGEIAETSGTSQIAYRHGMDVHLVEGSESNFKITTVEDLDNFRAALKKHGNGDCLA